MGTKIVNNMFVNKLAFPNKAGYAIQTFKIAHHNLHLLGNECVKYLLV